MSTATLSALWRAAGAGPVDHLFAGLRQLVLYESDVGLYFFHPPVAGDAEFYRRFYSTHQPPARCTEPPGSRVEFERAARHIPAGARVLDVGCRTGAFRQCLPHCTYVGLDPYAPPDAPDWVIRQDIDTHLGEARGTYDAVCAFQVVEHVTDPRAFVACLAALLRPGGLLIVAVPFHPSPLTAIPNLLINVPPHHLTWWSLDALSALAAAIDLVPVEIAALPASPNESLFYWMYRLSLFKAGPGSTERYVGHRWAWHLNLAFTYGLGRLAARWLPLPRGLPPMNAWLVARTRAALTPPGPAPTLRPA